MEDDTLSLVLEKDAKEANAFAVYLEESGEAAYLQFWLLVEVYRRTWPLEKRASMGKELFECYLTPTVPTFLRLDDNIRQDVAGALTPRNAAGDVFLEAHKAVWNVLTHLYAIYCVVSASKQGKPHKPLSKLLLTVCRSEEGQEEAFSTA